MTDITTNKYILAADDLIKHQKGFHKYWLEHGEPHPSSNDYLYLTRLYFFIGGMNIAIKRKLKKGIKL